MPGNHDVGFHYVLTPFLEKRFRSAFKTKPVQLKVIEGVPFVTINSMAFEGDDCFLCHSAVRDLAKLQDTLSSLPPPVLLSHFPLYRLSDLHCDEPDQAPPDEKETRFREKYDLCSHFLPALLPTRAQVGLHQPGEQPAPAAPGKATAGAQWSHPPRL